MFFKLWFCMNVRNIQGIIYLSLSLLLSFIKIPCDNSQRMRRDNFTDFIKTYFLNSWFPAAVNKFLWKKLVHLKVKPKIQTFICYVLKVSNLYFLYSLCSLLLIFISYSTLFFFFIISTKTYSLTNLTYSHSFLLD